MQAHIPVRHQQSRGEPHKGHKPIGMPEPQMRRARPDFPLVARNVSNRSETKLILARLICERRVSLLGSGVCWLFGFRPAWYCLLRRILRSILRLHRGRAHKPQTQERHRTNCADSYAPPRCLSNSELVHAQLAGHDGCQFKVRRYIVKAGKSVDCRSECARKANPIPEMKRLRRRLRSRAGALARTKRAAAVALHTPERSCGSPT